MYPAEKRQHARVRSFLRGEAVHSNGASRTGCTIRDISERGARIEAPPSVTLPEFFELLVPQRQLLQKVRIAWRHGSEIGVSFVAEAHAPAPNAAAEHSSEDQELNIRLRELESETARLRAELAEVQAVVQQFIQEKKTA